jgi:hypothetical protein
MSPLLWIFIGLLIIAAYLVWIWILVRTYLVRKEPGKWFKFNYRSYGQGGS